MASLGIKDNASPRSTIGADKNYDTADFVAGCRKLGCVPHVAQNNTWRHSAIDARTTRHASYKVSQIKRKPGCRHTAMLCSAKLGALLALNACSRDLAVGADPCGIAVGQFLRECL
jgi:hypothetical protein